MIRSIAALCFLALVVAACNNVVTGAGGTCGGAAITINATDGQAFSPSSATITNGQTVCWHNTGTSLTHSVTSNDGTSFNDATLAPGATFAHAFPVQGSFSYHCTFHGGMTGVINVN